MNKSGKVNNSSRVKESLSERPGRSKIRHPSGTYNPGVDIRYLGVRGDGGGGEGRVLLELPAKTLALQWNPALRPGHLVFMTTLFWSPKKFSQIDSEL